MGQAQVAQGSDEAEGTARTGGAMRDALQQDGVEFAFRRASSAPPPSPAMEGDDRARGVGGGAGARLTAGNGRRGTAPAGARRSSATRLLDLKGGRLASHDDDEQQTAPAPELLAPAGLLPRDGAISIAEFLEFRRVASAADGNAGARDDDRVAVFHADLLNLSLDDYQALSVQSKQRESKRTRGAQLVQDLPELDSKTVNRRPSRHGFSRTPSADSAPKTPAPGNPRCAPAGSERECHI